MSKSNKIASIFGFIGGTAMIIGAIFEFIKSFLYEPSGVSMVDFGAAAYFIAGILFLFFALITIIGAFQVRKHTKTGAIILLLASLLRIVVFGTVFVTYVRGDAPSVFTSLKTFLFYINDFWLPFLMLFGFFGFLVIFLSESWRNRERIKMWLEEHKRAVKFFVLVCAILFISFLIFAIIASTIGNRKEARCRELCNIRRI